jgi:glycerophosphoryl diester phosphodiesterase
MRIASSHRGAGAPSHIAPENTLSAIRAAIALGAALVEMDVRPTSDDTLVLMHDGSVERTTTGTGDLSSMTLAEVQALTLRTEGFRGDFSCDRVPTFAEALALAACRHRRGCEQDRPCRPDRRRPAGGGCSGSGGLRRGGHGPHPRGEPDLRFLIRGTTPEELATRLAAVAPAWPVYVHIDLSSPATMAPLVHAEGLRVFALGFVADAQYERGSLDAYEALYAAGCDMLQSNAIDRLGAFLGR